MPKQDIKLRVDYDGNEQHLKILDKAKFNKTAGGVGQTEAKWEFDVIDPTLKPLISELTLWFPPALNQMFTGSQQVTVPKVASGKYEVTLTINQACPPGTYPYIVSCDLDAGESLSAMAERLGIPLGELEQALENQKNFREGRQETKVSKPLHASPK